MPSAETILNDAAAIANGWRTLAIGSHAILGTLVLALVIGWRPSNRFAGYLFTAPLLSVGALAWASGNPFNGATFAALALFLIGVATRLSTEAVNVGSLPQLLPGALLVGFGWTYPHFLIADHWTAYTYASPFGLLPCPTLSAVIGLTLVLGMLRSKPWSLTLAAAGFAYGAIGVFKLGVTLDYGLLAGATTLGAIAGVSMSRPSSPVVRMPQNLVTEGPMNSPHLEMKVHDFLAQKRIAVAGVSRDRSRHPVGNLIYDRFKKSGHDVFPVNPHMQTFEGDRCYPDLQSIPGGVDGVVIITRPETTERIVRDCSDAGVHRVWMHQSIGKGTSVSPEAVEYCRQHDISAIAGACPMMYGAGVDFGHTCMRWILNLTGGLPT